MANKRALFRPAFLPTSEIESLPIVNGQFIIDSETLDYYIDEGGVRYGKEKITEVTSEQFYDLVKSKSLIKGRKYLVDYKYHNVYEYEGSYKEKLINNINEHLGQYYQYLGELEKLDPSNPYYNAQKEEYENTLAEYSNILNKELGSDLYSLNNLVKARAYIDKSYLDEKLIVTASSNDNIENTAFSTKYKNDDIDIRLLDINTKIDTKNLNYKIKDSMSNAVKELAKLNGSKLLVITNRRDSINNIECTFDFRGHYYFFLSDADNEPKVNTYTRIESDPVTSALSKFSIDDGSTVSVRCSYIKGKFNNSRIDYSFVDGFEVSNSGIISSVSETMANIIGSYIMRSICGSVYNSTIEGSEVPDIVNNSYIYDSVIKYGKVNNSNIKHSTFICDSKVVLNNISTESKKVWTNVSLNNVVFGEDDFFISCPYNGRITLTISNTFIDSASNKETRKLNYYSYNSTYVAPSEEHEGNITVSVVIVRSDIHNENLYDNIRKYDSIPLNRFTSKYVSSPDLDVKIATKCVLYSNGLEDIRNENN